MIPERYDSSNQNSCVKLLPMHLKNQEPDLMIRIQRQLCSISRNFQIEFKISLFRFFIEEVCFVSFIIV